MNYILLMIETFEHYDAGFKPRLSRRLVGYNKYKILEWGFKDSSVPIPTLNGARLAYWMAGKVSEKGEVPILAISDKPRLDITHNWYAGLVSIKDIEELKTDPMALHRHCGDLLIFGPRTVESVFESAVGSYRQDKTISSILSEVNVDHES